MSSVKRRWVRVMLYALALSGGVAAAQATHPGPAMASVVRSLPRTVVWGALPPDRAGDEAADPEVAAADREDAEPVASPADPFGRAFAAGRTITGSTPHRLVMFTFDDGPDRRTTPLLLDRLDAAGIKAVFFLTASRIAGHNVAERQQAAIARDIAARGHLIGSHTLDHAQLPLLEDPAARHQVVEAERVFERVLGGVPALFRPPGGARSGRIDALLAERGYTTVLWNLGTGDFQVRSGEQVFDTWRRVFDRRRAEYGDEGGIILMHDTYAWSVDAFEMILAELRRRNCELLSTDEELYDVVSDPALFFEARLDGDESPFAGRAMPAAEVLAARQARLRETTRERCLGAATL